MVWIGEKKLRHEQASGRIQGMKKRIMVILTIICLLGAGCDMITSEVQDEVDEVRNISIIAGISAGTGTTSLGTNLAVCVGCNFSSECASRVCEFLYQDSDSNGFYGNSGDAQLGGSRCVNASAQTVCGSLGFQ